MIIILLDSPIEYGTVVRSIIVSFLVFNAIMLSFHLFSCIFYESIGLALVFSLTLLHWVHLQVTGIVTDLSFLGLNE